MKKLIAMLLALVMMFALVACGKTEEPSVTTTAPVGENTTVGSDVMHQLLTHTTTDTSITGFEVDWKKAFGDTTLLKLIKNR